MYFRPCPKGLRPAQDDLAGHVVRYDGRKIPIHKAKKRIQHRRVPRSITPDRERREHGFHRRWKAWTKTWNRLNSKQWPASRHPTSHHPPPVGSRRPTADRMMAIASSTFQGLANDSSTATVKRSALVGIGNWRPVSSRLRYEYKPSDHQLADGAKETWDQRRTPMSIEDVAEGTLREIVPANSASRGPMWHDQLIVETAPPQFEAPPKTQLPMSQRSKTRPSNEARNPATLPTSPTIQLLGHRELNAEERRPTAERPRKKCRRSSIQWAGEFHDLPADKHQTLSSYSTPLLATPSASANNWAPRHDILSPFVSGYSRSDTLFPGPRTEQSQQFSPPYSPVRLPSPPPPPQRLPHRPRPQLLAMTELQPILDSLSSLERRVLPPSGKALCHQKRGCTHKRCSTHRIQFGSLQHKMVDTLLFHHPFGMRAGDVQRAVEENAEPPPTKTHKLCSLSERVQLGGIADVRTVQEDRQALLDLTIDRWGADGPCSAGGMPERKDISLRFQVGLKRNAASLAAKSTVSHGKKRGAEDVGGPRKCPRLAATTQSPGMLSSSHADTFQRISVHLSDYRTRPAPAWRQIRFLRNGSA
ncbi:hypothetical protein CspHIS471_0606020 [Cutaneotrichosporon sp. HIS471]|nr:hypothetical protein CspHIS471_0606020 [Cutaneotrichosporon sp. HIS471]